MRHLPSVWVKQRHIIYRYVLQIIQIVASIFAAEMGVKIICSSFHVDPLPAWKFSFAIIIVIIIIGYHTFVMI